MGLLRQREERATTACEVTILSCVRRPRVSCRRVSRSSDDLRARTARLQSHAARRRALVTIPTPEKIARRRRRRSTPLVHVP